MADRIQTVEKSKTAPLLAPRPSRRSMPGRTEERDSILRRLYPDLRRFAAVCASVDVDPDDLVQQAVVNTIGGRDLTELRDPGAYLRTAIANLARSSARGRDRTVPLVIDVAVHDVYPSELAAMQHLTSDERAALFLVDVERLGLAAAAGIVGCSTTALRARTSRARRKLRQALHQEENHS